MPLPYKLYLALVMECGANMNSPRVGLKTLPHKVDPNEDVRDLSGGDCDALIWLIVWCVWVCNESYIR